MSSKKICSWISINEHKFDIMRLKINILYLRCMNDSFQKINLIFCIKLTRSNFLNISQKLWASKFKFFLKRICAIESSFNKMIVILNEITTNTIIFFRVKFVYDDVLHKNLVYFVRIIQKKTIVSNCIHYHVQRQR